MSKGSVYIYNNKFLATNDIKEVTKFPTLKVYDWYLTKAEDEIMNTIKFNNVNYNIKSNNDIPTKGHILGAVPKIYTNTQGEQNCYNWLTIDENYNKVNFNPENHNTWKNMNEITWGKDTLIEIPTSWVKTEILSEGPYAGLPCHWIADYPAEGFHIHSCFILPDGSAGNLWVGKYISSKGDNNIPVSKIYYNPIMENDDVQVEMDRTDFKKNGLHYLDTNLTSARNIMSSKNSIYDTNWRYYNIYDHSFLTIMNLIETGYTYFIGKMINGDNYYAPYDREKCKKGMLSSTIYSLQSIGAEGRLFIDGLNTLNGVYNIFNPRNIGTYVNTGIECPLDEKRYLNKISYYYVNYGLKECVTGIHNGINFDDLLLTKKTTNNDFQIAYKASQSHQPDLTRNVAFIRSPGYDNNNSDTVSLFSIETCGDNFSATTSDKRPTIAFISRLSKTVPQDMPKYNKLTYNQKQQSPIFNNIDMNKFDITGQLTGVDAGSYKVSITPNGNNTWQNGSKETRKCYWNIDKFRYYIPYPVGAQIELWTNGGANNGPIICPFSEILEFTEDENIDNIDRNIYEIFDQYTYDIGNCMITNIIMESELDGIFFYMLFDGSSIAIEVQNYGGIEINEPINTIVAMKLNKYEENGEINGCKLSNFEFMGFGDKLNGIESDPKYWVFPVTIFP